MSKNYTKYSKFSQNNNVPPKVTEVVRDENDAAQAATLTVEIPDETQVELGIIEPTFGIVTGCKKLYVRTEPDKNSEPLDILDKDEEVEIDTIISTPDDFYCVTTSTGIVGYCMKQYIKIK